MNETKIKLSPYSKYAILKDYSSTKEKDNLIQSILSDNSEFSEKEEQVNNAFGEWLGLQENKHKSNAPIENKYLFIAQSIKSINKNEINIGIVDNKNKYEFWIICKTKDYAILDNIYDIYENHYHEIPKPIDFIFLSERQFVGKDNVVFLTII